MLVNSILIGRVEVIYWTLPWRRREPGSPKHQQASHYSMLHQPRKERELTTHYCECLNILFTEILLLWQLTVSISNQNLYSVYIKIGLWVKLKQDLLIYIPQDRVSCDNGHKSSSHIIRNFLADWTLTKLLKKILHSYVK
jgi:hypothetical protein